MSLDQLSQEYLDWCLENNMRQMSADEFLVEDTVPKTLEQKRYLGTFIERWESISVN